jgi:diguanylate cyclase (GGDEF)-like protein
VRVAPLERAPAVEFRSGERHGRRLETLWRLAGAPHDDRNFVRRLLVEAARVLRVEVAFHGLLAHLEGEEIVVDVAHDPPDGLLVTAFGARSSIDRGLLRTVLRGGRTVVSSVAHAEGRFGVWRTFIATPFRVGARIYFIAFVSPEALDEPLDMSDRTYVETLASFCASRLHQRAQVDRLRYQTEHDALTGILNRSSFRSRGFAALSEYPRTAVAVIDIDRFREVNDTLGHLAGDAVLVEIAAALQGCAAEPEVVARLGGDSFGILIPLAGERAEVGRRVAHFLAVFDQAFSLGDREGTAHVRVTASCGIAIAPDDAVGFEQLLARADTASYDAKLRGRGRSTFFDPRVEDAFAQARRLQNELADALRRGEFVLYFQPHVELTSGRPAGAEVLVRWQHPERGLLTPPDFIPFAEKHGMIGAIDGWVMRESVRLSQRWRAREPAFRLWFNLSRAQLGDPAMTDWLAESAGDLGGIGVEISEPVAMREGGRELQTAALRERGLALALDGFGSGHSSLADLKGLPVDAIKIDRTFTAGLPGDDGDEAIVEAVIAIGRRLRVAVIAVGVETAEQAAWLRDAGCNYGQGFHFAAPMPAQDFDAWLAAAHETRGSLPRI